MEAFAVGAYLAGDRVVLVDYQHPAVDRVRHRDLTVLQQVRVIRLVQVPLGRAWLAGVTVRPDDLPRRVGDLDDRLVLLLVGDDRRAVVGEERVVGKVEAQLVPRGGRRRVPPHHVHRGVKQQQPVVAAVGDEQLVPEIRRPRAWRARGSEGPVRADHLDGGDAGAVRFPAHDPGDRAVRRDAGVRDRHLKPAGRQQAPSGGVVGPDGGDRPGRRGRAFRSGVCDWLSGQLRSAESWGGLGCGRALAAGDEQFPVHGDRRGARQCLGQVADDRRGAPGRVDGLDDADRRPGVRSGDGLAAERVDAPAQGGDRRVSHRNRQRGDDSVGLAVRGRHHRRVGLASVKAAHDVRRGPDGGGLGIGARRGQVPDVGRSATTGQRERLDRADTGRRSAPEDQCPLSRHRNGRVVYRDGQRADPAHRAGGRAHGVNPVRRRVAG